MNSTEMMITPKMMLLASARRWRRNRRHASSHGENCRALIFGVAVSSAVADAGIEPSIKNICDEIEQDHQNGGDEGHAHHDRRVVGENGADQQRPDAGNAEDLLGDDGAAE